MIAARLSGIEVRAGRARLIGPVSLAIERGEHVLLVGPSGSGKTTILRVLAGLTRPASGTVEWFGEPASRDGRILIPPERRGVGFLFQNGGLWPHMSVRRTLEFTLQHAGRDRAERRRRAAELIERVGLEGLEERRPGTLSGGEAQRLALARALAVEPRMLLLDEPLGPLDAERRGALLELLAGLHRDLGLTAVHVTHDPAEAAALGTRTVRCVDGRVEEEAP